MPLYDYRCKHCGTEFEHLVMHSSPPARCPKCTGGDLDQLVSGYAVSSEGTRAASLSSQHRKMAAVRQDRARGEHQHLHEHFEDKTR